MRPILLFVFLVSVGMLKAQSFVPGSFYNNPYAGGSAIHPRLADSIAARKWSVSKYAAFSSSFAFFRGGNAAIVSAPIGVQLNRRINNNLYAFAGVSLAPSYINFGRSFMSSDFKANQQSTFLRPGNLGIYSRAELGLQYTNDEKTFSISGSIGVERSSYPIFQYGPMYDNRPHPVLSTNR